MDNALRYDTLTAIDIPESVLNWVQSHARAVDSGHVEAREAFPRFAAAGLTSLGAPFNRDGRLLEQAAAVEMLARESFRTAFALWGHRMCVEFLELAGGDFAKSVLPEICAGTIPGASAMAPGYKALSGFGDLCLQLTRDGQGGLRLSGRVAWASNLYPDAVVVAPAYGPDAGSTPSGAQGGVVVSFPSTVMVSKSDQR